MLPCFALCKKEKCKIVLIEIVSSLPMHILKYQGKGQLFKTRFLLSCGLYANALSCPAALFLSLRKATPFSLSAKEKTMFALISLSHAIIFHSSATIPGMTKEVAHSSSTAGAYETAFTLYCPDCQSRRQVGRRKRRVTR